MAAGGLASCEAADLAKVLDVCVQVLATEGFEERLAKLEASGNRDNAAGVSA